MNEGEAAAQPRGDPPDGLSTARADARWATRRTALAGIALLVGVLSPFVETIGWESSESVGRRYSWRAVWIWDDGWPQGALVFHAALFVLALTALALAALVRGELRGRVLAGSAFVVVVFCVVQALWAEPRSSRPEWPALVALIVYLSAAGLLGGNHVRKAFPASVGMRRLTGACGTVITIAGGLVLAVAAAASVSERRVQQGVWPSIVVLLVFCLYGVLGMFAFRRPRGSTSLPTATSVVGYLLAFGAPLLFLALMQTSRARRDEWVIAIDVLKVYGLGIGALFLFATGLAEWATARLRAGTPDSRRALGDVFR